MIADIKFNCSQCGQRMLVAAAAAGRTADCPTCGRPVTIPVAGEIGELPYKAHSRAKKKSFSPGTLAHGEPGVGGEDLTVARAEIAHFREQALAAQAECERLHANATHAQAESKSFQTERLALKNDLAQWKQRAAALSTQLTERELELDQLREQQGSLELDLLAHREQWDAVTGQLAERAAACAALAEERAVLEHELRSKGDELTTAQLTLEETAHALSTANAALAVDQANSVQARTEQATAVNEVKRLNAQCSKLRGETEKLRASLSKTAMGRDLVSVRTALEQAEGERERLRSMVSALEKNGAASEGERVRLTALTGELRVQLEVARKKAEAASAERLTHDNEILRGIVARQNLELEIRHRDIVRLKRARWGVKLAYSVFALGLLALAYFALRTFSDFEITF